MDFTVRGFKQNEFDMTIRYFLKENKITDVKIEYTELDSNVTTTIADDIISRLTPAQFRELNAIK